MYNPSNTIMIVKYIDFDAVHTGIIHVVSL